MALADRLPWRRRAQARQAGRAQWLESAVARAVEGQMLRAQRAAFEAADTSHYVDGWAAENPNINDALAAHLPTLRARASDMARNNEWARRYLLQLRTNVLGPQGIRLQMRMTLRDGTPNYRVNNAIEAAWAQFGRAENCDPGARLTWRAIEQVSLYALPRAGELLGRHVDGGPHGYQYQPLNPAVLDVSLRRSWGTNRVRMGVEIDAAGRAVAYWLQADGDAPWQVGRYQRVPADSMLHAFDPDEPDQLRGYPRLAIGAQRLWLLKDFERSAAVASSNAAKRVGFFYTADGAAPPGFGDQIISQVIEQAKAAGRVMSADEISALQETARKFTTTVPGQYDTLPEGTRFEPNKADYPHVAYGEYIKACVRGWSAGQGVSYATLGNDLEAVNYSSAQVGVIDERWGYRVDQQWLVEHLHRPVFERWLPRALLAVPGLRALPYDRLPQYLAAATWQPRRWGGFDPLKEANAHGENLRNRLTSRRRVLLDRGEDPDEVFAEIEAEEERFGPAQPAPVPPASDAPADTTDAADAADAAAEE